MQCLQHLVLLEELHDSIVARLAPVEHHCDFHNQLHCVPIAPRLGQNEINIVLFAHFIDDLKEILLLYLPSLIVLDLPYCLERGLSNQSGAAISATIYTVF